MTLSMYAYLALYYNTIIPIIPIIPILLYLLFITYGLMTFMILMPFMTPKTLQDEFTD